MSKNLDIKKVTDNLTPKERVLLIVHNEVKKETTGKEILTEAEEHAISSGWRPTTNEQVREYNRYNQGWRLAGFAELDAQTAFLDIQIIFYKEKQASWHLLSYPFFREAKQWLKRLRDLRPVTLEQAQETIKKQREDKLKGGLDYSRAIYEYAFESLNEEVREDILTLYAEAKTETDYLDTEEELADLFKGKEKLTAEDKEKLAGLILKRAYNRFAKEWQFWHYYASIPIRRIGEKWLDKRGIKPPPPTDKAFNEAFEKARIRKQAYEKREISLEEGLREYTAETLNHTITEYAKEHKTTVEAELKAVTLEWLNNGLLEEYIPLFKSTSTEEYNGKTKKPHNEIFRIWLEAKARAKEKLDRYISGGELNREGEIITGESLYSFKGNYEFAREFREYVDRYDANLGIVYPDNDPEHKGKHLDRELLITDLDKEGKPYPINISQMAIRHLEGYFDAMEFVKEKEENGERVIGFADDTTAYGELMKNTTAGLKKHYAYLLTFRELFRRLSKTYEIGLTYKIDKWIKEAERYIDHHNHILEEATKRSYTEIKDKKTVRLKDNLFIDKDSIKPDQERVIGYFKELEETLGEDF